MLLGERGNIDRRDFVLSNAAQMIQPRLRQPALAPIMYGGDASVRLPCYLGGATKCVDKGVSEAVHKPASAKMAYIAQEVLCQNGICQYGILAVHVASMELEEIRGLMKAKGYTQADLANVLGIDPTAVSKRLTGRRPFKHHEMIKTEAWLSPDTPVTALQGEAVRMLPIIGKVAAGSWREALEQPSGHLPVAGSTAPRNGIALRVFGDSMDLEIEDGGIVVVDLDDKALYPGSLFVVLNEAGETTFKQFELNPARLVPRSTNPEHKAIQIGDGQQFTVVGRVTSLTRNR